MTGDASTLARRFARTLEQLRTSYDVQYVGTRPLPEPAAEPPLAAGARGDEATGERATADDPIAPSPSSTPNASSVTSASTPSASTASSALSRSAASSSPSISHASSTPPTSTAPRGTAPALSAAAPPAPERGSSHAPQPHASDRTLPLIPQATAQPSAPEPSTASAPREPEPADRQALREQAQQWSPARKLEYLRVHNVGDCQRCPLARTRNHIVFGVGNPQADVMFVGEAPGADEDRQGEPFVGRAGQLLNQWLAELGLAREDVYIANVLKCRPPGNRDPRPEEVDRCSPFLQAQIRAIEPKVIVALGRHAGMLLSRREDMTLRAMRSGRLHYDAGAAKGDPSARVMIPLVVTYHPAYVLRQEGDGRPSAPGQASPTAMVMTDLNRALAIAREGA
jgi:uracil-DNA glycosylase family 4